MGRKLRGLVSIPFRAHFLVHTNPRFCVLRTKIISMRKGFCLTHGSNCTLGLACYPFWVFAPRSKQ